MKIALFEIYVDRFYGEHEEHDFDKFITKSYSDFTEMSESELLELEKAVSDYNNSYPQWKIVILKESVRPPKLFVQDYKDKIQKVQEEIAERQRKEKEKYEEKKKKALIKKQKLSEDKERKLLKALKEKFEKTVDKK